MKRNIESIIKKRKGNIPTAYDLSLDDLRTLETLAKVKENELEKLDVVKLLSNTFVYGYEMGVRASSRNHANKRKD